MSQTLGEKLRQAREERGISISEVAEQTRISSLYLESIERDDYKPLPGGIFNKGFVKSYAKFIGFDEQEALSDYARLAAANEIVTEHEQKVYRPEVLTDDRTSSSMLPTVLFAGVILALMTGGILFLVNYIQNRDADPAVTTNSSTPANSAASNIAGPSTQQAGNVPKMESLKVEFKAANDPISLSSVSDGRMATAVVTSGSIVTFEPRESLRLSYSKSLASSAQLSINGRPIALPDAPPNPRRNAIEFEINNGNLGKIWQEGRISFDVPSASDANANVVANSMNATVPPATAPTRPPATPAPRPSATISRTPAPAANTAGSASNAAVRPTPN